jgi:hypothetical protein
MGGGGKPTVFCGGKNQDGFFLRSRARLAAIIFL